MIRHEEATSNRIYDSRAATYGYDIQSTLSSKLKYDLVLKYMESHFKVLDVGCANGIHMQALASSCATIVGIDINDKMLAMAQEKFREKGIVNTMLYKQSATSLEFDNECFDLVYSFSTLLLVPDTRRAIGEIVRVLKIGGLAVLDVTGRYNLSQVYWSWFYRRHGHFGVNAFSFKELTVLIRQLGLELLEQHALGFADQWKYIPGIHKLKFLEKIFHGQGIKDLDYRISNSQITFPLANRWYIVCRKAH